MRLPGSFAQGEGGQGSEGTASMASVTRNAGGLWRVLFTGGDGVRRTVRLGDVNGATARSIKLRIETLIEAKEMHRSLDVETCAWLKELPPRMYDRIARAGLVEAREAAEVPTLGKLLERFASTASVKPSTRAAYKQTTDSLGARFGLETPLAKVTTGHADEWRKSLADSGLAPATVAKRVHVARCIFRKAVRWGMVPTSPFAELRAGSQANPARSFHVPREWMGAILAACPGDEWRAIVGLGRYAGLRIPSELVCLTWGDVNWDRGILTVRSPKTEAHAGGAVRMVPIASELRPILQALFDAAEPGTVRILPRVRDGGTNLRTTFEKILARAGVKPWPRLFQNLRASCETDWVESFPAHVVAAWLGHSPTIAARHYLQTLDRHFAEASGAPRRRPNPGRDESYAKSDARATQNAAQQATAPLRTVSHDEAQQPCFAGVSRPHATGCEDSTEGESGRYWTRTSDLFHVKEAR